MLSLPPEFATALESSFFRPPPVFAQPELKDLMTFVRASGIRPEGAGGAKFDLGPRPYLTQLYNEQRDKPFRRLVIQKAAQTGLTVKLIYRAAWLTADARRRLNTALMFPTQEAVYDLHKSRFRPMMTSSSKMMKLVSDVDAVGLVRLGVSTMRFRGMKSGIAVDSFPADALLFDEVRLMDLATIERVFVRVSQSKLEGPGPDGVMRRGLLELNSTAGFPNMDINLYFQRSTQNYWRTPCPNARCKNHKHGIVMPLRWPDIVGQQGDRLYYKCPDCDVEIPDEWLLTQGFYLPENPGASWDGYQFSQVLSGTAFLPELWAAYTRGDNLTEFWNSRMGLPWQDPDAVPATKDIVESCIDSSGTYRWPRPDEIQGEWVAMGVDQRAPEKHVTIWKLGPGGLFDLVHLEVVEASGTRAVEMLEHLYHAWNCKICVIDGEPSYDLAVELGRQIKGKVWLADYAENRAHSIEFVDDRSKKSIKKASGEVKYEFRVLIDRYKGMDWALTQFGRGRIRLPADLYDKTQVRTLAGVSQKWQIAKELVNHLENIARATVPRYATLPNGEQVLTGEVRRIYRNLALDPHFAHAHLYALSGLARASGNTQLLMSGETQLKEPEPNQLEAIMKHGTRPSDLKKETEQAKKRTCGGCKYMRGLQGDEGLCGHVANSAQRLKVRMSTPACSLYRRKR